MASGCIDVSAILARLVVSRSRRARVIACIADVWGNIEYVPASCSSIVAVCAFAFWLARNSSRDYDIDDYDEPNVWQCSIALSVLQRYYLMMVVHQ